MNACQINIVVAHSINNGLVCARDQQGLSTVLLSLLHSFLGSNHFLKETHIKVIGCNFTYSAFTV